MNVIPFTFKKDPTKPTVVYEQYITPHYQVPFFEKLSKRVNLLVVTTAALRLDGAHQPEQFSFPSLCLPETPHALGLHPDIFQVLKEVGANIYISYNGPLTKILSTPALTQQLRATGAQTIWMGCDGYWVHHFWIEKFFRFFRFWNPRKVYYSLRETWVDRQVDAFAAHSTHMARYLRIVHGVPTRKITVTHNAVETKGLVNAYHAREHLLSEREPRAIVFVGRLTEGKRVDILLHAFAQIQRTYPDATLTIIGEGSKLSELKGLAVDLKLERVRFLGGMYDDAALAQATKHASLAVMPGLGGLGLNTVMALGLPVIYTHADGTEEDLIKPHYNGWYFNGSVSGLVKALDQALREPEQLATMGKRSVELIEKRFTLDAMVDGYVQIISKLTNQYENS